MPPEVGKMAEASEGALDADASGDQRASRKKRSAGKWQDMASAAGCTTKYSTHLGATWKWHSSCMSIKSENGWRGRVQQPELPGQVDDDGDGGGQDGTSSAYPFRRVARRGAATSAVYLPVVISGATPHRRRWNVPKGTAEFGANPHVVSAAPLGPAVNVLLSQTNVLTSSSVTLLLHVHLL